MAAAKHVHQLQSLKLDKLGNEILTVRHNNERIERILEIRIENGIWNISTEESFWSDKTIWCLEIEEKLRNTKKLYCKLKLVESMPAKHQVKSSITTSIGD